MNGPTNENKAFWQKFYTSSHEKMIQECSSFAQFVYKKYVEAHNSQKVSLKILDLGCGNCRDLCFFAKMQNICYGVDSNGVLNLTNGAETEDPSWAQNCTFCKEDAETHLLKDDLCTMFDIVYMRWFLHAAPYEASSRIFKLAAQKLKPGGKICVEVRSSNDKGLVSQGTYMDDGSHFTTHKRWLYSIQRCSELARENNLEILFLEEGLFSPLKHAETTDPVLIRFVCSRRRAEEFKNSPNFPMYRHIIPKMKDQTVRSYFQMDIMNGILEKHGIKYVAVAGTNLGLNRHGGIIPWDNDIDIGFLKEDWEKLQAIRPYIESMGLCYNRVQDFHCHFGHIDCFCLHKETDGFFTGCAGTMISKTELRNVKKQVFGYTTVLAASDCRVSLRKRYGSDYFTTGNVNDNFHFKDKSVKNFKLDNADGTYCVFTEEELKK